MMWNLHNWCFAPSSSIIWGYVQYPSVIIVYNGNPERNVIKKDLMYFFVGLIFVY